MADLQVQETGSTGNAPVNAATLVYVLFAVAVFGTLLSSGLVAFGPFLGIAGLVGVIVAYVTRGGAQGSWVASHLRWLIRTFWWSLLWDLIAVLLMVTIIGIPFGMAIMAATSIWGVYRLVRGFLQFKDSQAMPGM